MSSVNIANDLPKEELVTIGTNVVDGYLVDKKSRGDWEKAYSDWSKLALQISEKKTFPWAGASNVKFPILATAAMQFAARAYPTLVPSDGKVVKCKIIGSDPTGEKTNRATRISKHMSYQVLFEMEEWEEEMDKLLLTLPIAGTVFKKTYFSKELGRNVSSIVLPQDLIVNYWTKNFDTCERVTQYIEMSPRILKEKQLTGVYREVNLGEAQYYSQKDIDSDPNMGTMPSQDETTPYIILEQHTYLDLDKDGYAEPYVVVVEFATKQVLRIVARYNQGTVFIDDDDNVIRIEPVQYFTKYSFIPNPDGGFYDIGFGRLLGPINAAVDTVLNQLIDAGSLSNLQSGFISKGLRAKMGESRFQPGEWKTVNATGQDLKNGIFALPVREPSAVLFKVLELLIQSSKELASVAEIFVGKMPGQNTPATTTMATIEQGMKLFTAVYKRVYRAMAKEFRKLYLLNRDYLDSEVELDILDEPIQQSDYEGNEKDIVPAADPQAASMDVKMQKAQQLTQLIPLGTINPMEVTSRLLEAMEEPNPEKLLMQPQPQQDPKAETEKLKAELERAKFEHQVQVDGLKLQQESAAKEHSAALEARVKEMDLKYKEQEAMIKALTARAMATQNLQQKAEEHQQKLVQSSEAHKAKLQQMKESKSNVNRNQK